MRPSSSPMIKLRWAVCASSAIHAVTVRARPLTGYSEELYYRPYRPWDAPTIAGPARNGFAEELHKDLPEHYSLHNDFKALKNGSAPAVDQLLGFGGDQEYVSSSRRSLCAQSDSAGADALN